MSIVAQNISRLNHLLALFKLSKDEFLDILNERSKTKINEEDVFGSFVKISTLNKVDDIFDKGIAYYANPEPPISSSEESIFFRKDNFNSTLNLSAKQLVNKYEEEKVNFDTLLKLSDIDSARILPAFTIADNPVKCAEYIRSTIYPPISSTPKEFLIDFISSLAEKNILVFEFVQNSRKKNPANISGCYIAPNAILLKHQKYPRREVFTLAHEVAHYLLNEEDIDEKVSSETFYENLNEVEKWCNDFAFSFLAGSYQYDINNLDYASSNNDLHHEKIKEISQNTHLSELSIYTHLLFNNKISKANYQLVYDDTVDKIKKIEEEEKRLLEAKKLKLILEGKKPGGGATKPLFSPLYLQTLQTALYNGLVDEYEFCRRLKIKPDKIEKYLV